MILAFEKVEIKKNRFVDLSFLGLLDLDGALRAKTGELERVVNILKAELVGFFFQWGDEALVEADGGAALAANDVVMVVARLLGQVEGFAFEGESLGEAGLAEGVEDSVDGGAVAHL